MPVTIWIKTDSPGHGFVAVKILHAIRSTAILHREDVTEFIQRAVKFHARSNAPRIRHRMRDKWVVNRITREIFLTERNVHSSRAHVQLAVVTPQLRYVLEIQIQF